MLPRKTGGWLAVAFACTQSYLVAADWPGFRGPDGSGVADAAEYPSELDPATNLHWKVAVRPGKSSPVVIADRLFLTAHEGDRRFVVSYDVETGEEIWAATLTVDRSEPRHDLNDAAAPTIASDGEKIFAFFADFGLLAYSLEGDELWRQPLGPFTTFHGMASSPVYADGKLLLLADQVDGSYIAAFDPDNGETLWRTARPDVSGSQSTPTVYRDEVIAVGPYQVKAYELGSGKERWSMSGLPAMSKTLPVVADGLLFVGARGAAQPPVYEDLLGSFDGNANGVLEIEEFPDSLRTIFASADEDDNGAMTKQELDLLVKRDVAATGLRAIRLGGQGDVTQTHLTWSYPRGVPSVSAPLIYDGSVYMVRSGGIVTALDAQTGRVLKQGRLRDAIDSYYASPVAADGKIYTLSETGKVSVIEAGASWRSLSTLDLAEDAYATPALSDGSVYVRTMQSLYRFADEAN